MTDSYVLRYVTRSINIPYDNLPRNGYSQPGKKEEDDRFATLVAQGEVHISSSHDRRNDRKPQLLVIHLYIYIYTYAHGTLYYVPYLMHVDHMCMYIYIVICYNCSTGVYIYICVRMCIHGELE